VAVGLYFDHNVSRVIAQGLRLREVDVLTAFEDGTQMLPDSELLDRATALGRPLFSSDEDLIVEARRRQREGVPFAGVIFAPQSAAVSTCIDQLEILAKAGDLVDFADRLLFVPLR
jgi:hypothetical protein